MKKLLFQTATLLLSASAFALPALAQSQTPSGGTLTPGSGTIPTSPTIPGTTTPSTRTPGTAPNTRTPGTTPTTRTPGTTPTTRTPGTRIPSTTIPGTTTPSTRTPSTTPNTTFPNISPRTDVPSGGAIVIPSTETFDRPSTGINSPQGSTVYPQGIQTYPTTTPSGTLNNRPVQ